MMGRKSLLSALLFAVFGALGAVISWLLFYFDFRFDILGWVLWPARMFGMGMGHLSGAFWMVLVLLNALLFGVLGALVGVSLSARLSVAWAFLITALLAWCAWLSGFVLSAEVAISALCVVLFYSAPFLLIARIRSAG